MIVVAGFWESVESQPYSLDFILREPLFAAVVKLGRAGTLMRGHRLSMFERAAVLEIGRDTSRTETMVADRGMDAGRHCATADHAPGIGLCHWLPCQHSRIVPWTCAEQPSFAVVGDARCIDVYPQFLGKDVMTRHRM